MAETIYENLSKLEQLEQKRQDLQKTLQLVQDFPSKVSYDRLIPVTKVAFCHGKIVHTNEFKVAEVGGSEKDISALDFISYKDAAQILQGRLQLVDSSISSETGVGFAPKTPPASSSSAGAPNLKDNKPITQTSAATTISSSMTPKPSSTLKASSVDEHVVSNGQSQNGIKDRIFEIREYFDDQDAASPGHELMDITEQIENLEKLSQSESFQHGPGGQNPYLQREDSEFIQELAKIAAEQSREDFSSEDSFVYDEDAVPHQHGRNRRDMPPVDDIFERIEQQQRQQIEAQLLRQKKSSVPTNNGLGGWKSGFLGGGGGEKAKKKPVLSTSSAAAVSVEPAAALLPTPPAIQSSTVELEGASVQSAKKKGVSFSSTNDVQEIDNRETMAQKIRDMAIEERKVAMATAAAERHRPASDSVAKQPVRKPFSGTIMEKFP